MYVSSNGIKQHNANININTIISVVCSNDKYVYINLYMHFER